MGRVRMGLSALVVVIVGGMGVSPQVAADPELPREVFIDGVYCHDVAPGCAPCMLPFSVVGIKGHDLFVLLTMADGSVWVKDEKKNAHGRFFDLGTSANYHYYQIQEGSVLNMGHDDSCQWKPPNPDPNDPLGPRQFYSEYR